MPEKSAADLKREGHQMGLAQHLDIFITAFGLGAALEVFSQVTRELSDQEPAGSKRATQLTGYSELFTTLHEGEASSK